MSMKSALWGLVSVAALSGLSLDAAFAGHPGAVHPGAGHSSAGYAPAAPCASPDGCAFDVHVMPSRPAQHGPMTIQQRTSFDHYKSIQFQQAPHMSILRVHGLPDTPGLSDAPAGFTGGCHPGSTRYCRKAEATVTDVPPPAPLPLPQPVPAPKPFPVPKPLPAPAPVVRPVPLPTPCQPVIAPCGPVIGRPSVLTVPAPSAPYASGSGYPQLAGAPAVPAGLSVSSSTSRYGVQTDSTYWEKVSGPTTIGGMTATEVVCKRQLPGTGLSGGPVCRTPVAASSRY